MNFLKFSMLLLSSNFFIVNSVVAQPDFFSAIETNDEEIKVAEENFQYKGYIQQKIKYGLEAPSLALNAGRNKRGLKQVQTDIFAELSGDLSESVRYEIGLKGELEILEWENGEQQWQLNYEELFLRNAFLDVVFDNGHWLRAGNQVFAWGESESLSITDVLSPYDLREFGQTELRDIREPIPALMYSLPIAGDKLILINTWKANENRYAGYGEEFYAYADFDNLGLAQNQQDPGKEWEMALRYERFLNGGDFSVVAAEVNDNDLYFSLVNSVNNEVQFRQARVKILGAAFNRVVASLQIKGEIGLHKDKAVNLGSGAVEAEDQWRGMLGIEYTGINDWQFGYEINAVKIRNSQRPSDSNSAPGHVLRIQQSSLNERLTQQFWWMDLLDDSGQVLRWSLEYDWNDQWSFSTGVVIYRVSDDTSDFYSFRKNDSFNFSATFNF